MIVLPETLKGRIVLFHLYSSNDTTIDGNHVIQVSEIESEFVYGGFIASELIGENERGTAVHTLSLTNQIMKGYHLSSAMDYPETRIWRALITNYEILTVKELPLLIGYKHTTSLLAELIKGEI